MYIVHVKEDFFRAHSRVCIAYKNPPPPLLLPTKVPIMFTCGYVKAIKVLYCLHKILLGFA